MKILIIKVDISKMDEYQVENLQFAMVAQAMDEPNVGVINVEEKTYAGDARTGVEGKRD